MRLWKRLLCSLIIFLNFVIFQIVMFRMATPDLPQSYEILLWIWLEYISEFQPGVNPKQIGLSRWLIACLETTFVAIVTVVRTPETDIYQLQNLHTIQPILWGSAHFSLNLISAGGLKVRCIYYILTLDPLKSLASFKKKWLYLLCMLQSRIRSASHTLPQIWNGKYRHFRITLVILYAPILLYFRISFVEIVSVTSSS